ncbi:unnamed protein product [Lathyrus sativus]|nr:unnamed protein product [Lathyrus sativus]
MKRFFTRGISKYHFHSKLKKSQPQIMAGNISNPSGSNVVNILLNRDFSDGLNSWHPNSCNAYVISAKAGNHAGISIEPDRNYAVITDQNECWQGLEQNITDRISVGSIYTVLAFVGVFGSGLSHESADVKATLKLEYHGSATQYLFIGSTSVIKGSWEKLEGTFSLSTKPDRVIFYLEGPCSWS